MVLGSSPSGTIPAVRAGHYLLDIPGHCGGRGSLRKDEHMRKNLKEARQRAGMTQQQIADRLGLTLRHYQKIEYAEIGGSYEVWDALEDLLGIHQRKLREISNNRPAPRENP